MQIHFKEVIRWARFEFFSYHVCLHRRLHGDCRRQLWLEPACSLLRRYGSNDLAGQFNLDLCVFLRFPDYGSLGDIISRLADLPWVLLAFFGGIMVVALYLFFASFKANGDMKVLLLGRSGQIAKSKKRYVQRCHCPHPGKILNRLPILPIAQLFKTLTFPAKSFLAVIP